MPQFHINQKLMNSIALLMTILTFCWFIKSLWLLVVEPDWCFNKAIHHSCTIWRHFAGICNVWCYSLLHTSREAIERNHSAAEGNNLSKSASQSLGFFLLCLSCLEGESPHSIAFYKSFNVCFEQRFHMNHHFRIRDKGFGISSSLWDIVFGTLPPAKAAKA